MNHVIHKLPRRPGGLVPCCQRSLDEIPMSHSLSNEEANCPGHVRNFLYFDEATREYAEDTGMFLKLEDMEKLMGSLVDSLTMKLTNDHSWSMERILGVLQVSFLCPGGDGDHSPACREDDSENKA